MTDQKTISVYDSQVGSYEEMLKNLPVDEILIDFISRLKPNDFVLDLGCGPAYSSATMREHGLRVDPTDASIEMISLANKTFDIGARRASFAEIDGKDIYDGIWANFSLLHATSEELPDILSLLHQSLNPKGIFHLGMKVGKGSSRDKLDRFYSYYTEDELRNLLNNAGFSVEHVRFGEAYGLAGDLDPWITLRSIS